MKKYVLFFCLVSTLWTLVSCNNSKNTSQEITTEDTLSLKEHINKYVAILTEKEQLSLLPFDSLEELNTYLILFFIESDSLVVKGLQSQDADVKSV